MVAKSRTEYICFMANGVDIIDGGLFHHPSKTGVRPVFMEPLPPRGVLLPRDGGHYRRGIIVSNDNRAVRMMRRSSSSSSFPLKDDAGYIGYLTDDDESVGGSGDQRESAVMKIVDRRRRELMGSDISFSDCMFMMVAVGGLLLLFLFAASPWGVPPPRRL